MRAAPLALAIAGAACGAPLADETAPPPREDATCPAHVAAQDRGPVAAADLVELSGLAASRSQPGVLWAHNDSGDLPRLFALRAVDAGHIGTYSVTGAIATDWEDVAIGPHDGADALFIGDIGDNDEARASIRVYIVPEPAVALDGSPNGGPTSGEAPGAITVTLTYPDGPHDAEALMVDPRSGDLYLVTKSANGMSQVFEKRAPHVAAELAELEAVAALQFGPPPLAGAPEVTAGDISPDGARVIIRTYDSAFVFLRSEHGTVAEALSSSEPCSVPLAEEPQGEAIAFDVDGRGYFTASERKGAAAQPLWLFSAPP